MVLSFVIPIYISSGPAHKKRGSNKLRTEWYTTDRQNEDTKGFIVLRPVVADFTEALNFNTYCINN